MRKIFFLTFLVASILFLTQGRMVLAGSCPVACTTAVCTVDQDSLSGTDCPTTEFCCVPKTNNSAPFTCPTGFEEDGGVCFPNADSVGLSNISVFQVVTNVLNWLLGILGILGVLAFVISGVQYLVSAGDEDLSKTAKRNMTYAIIGLVVALAGLIVVSAIAGLLGAG